MKRSGFIGGAAGAAAGIASGAGDSFGAGLTWDQLLAAARREGSVNIAGPADPGIRKALADGFQGDTGIAVSYEGLEPNVLDTRVDREGAAGKPTLDVMVGGSSELLQLVPKGLLAPIKPILCLPGSHGSSQIQGRTTNCRLPMSNGRCCSAAYRRCTAAS